MCGNLRWRWLPSKELRNIQGWQSTLTFSLCKLWQREFEKICSLHHASTKLDVGYVGKDIKDQVTVITRAVEIPPLLAVKSIYAKSCRNISHNSAASVKVPKTWSKMKVFGLVAFFFFFFFLVVTESWFQGADSAANRLRYPCSNVSDPSTALGVLWSEHEPRLRVHQMFLGMAGISCIWNGSTLAIAQAIFNFLLHIYPSLCQKSSHNSPGVTTPSSRHSSPKILMLCSPDLRDSG